MGPLGADWILGIPWGGDMETEPPSSSAGRERRCDRALRPVPLAGGPLFALVLCARWNTICPLVSLFSKATSSNSGHETLILDEDRRGC